MTTDRYCLSLFFCIFSRLTSERDALEHDLAAEFLLDDRGDDGLDEALVAGGAADHELLALGAQDTRRCKGSRGGARGCEDGAAVEDGGL